MPGNGVRIAQFALLLDEPADEQGARLADRGGSGLAALLDGNLVFVRPLAALLGALRQ